MMSVLGRRARGTLITGNYASHSSDASMKNTFRVIKQGYPSESENQNNHIRTHDKSNEVSKSKTFYRLRARDSSPKVIHEEKKRNLEFEWIQDNKDKLSKFAGQWIALQGKRLVSHGPNFKIVKSQAKEKGFTNPLIFFVSDEDSIL